MSSIFFTAVVVTKVVREEGGGGVFESRRVEKIKKVFLGVGEERLNFD